MNFKYAIVLLATCGACGTTSNPIAPTPESSELLDVTVFPEETFGIDYGLGVNTRLGLDGLSKSKCVMPDELTTMGGQSGERVKIFVNTITSHEEFYEKIGKNTGVVINYVAKKGAKKAESWLSGIDSLNADNSFDSLMEIRLKRDAAYALVVAEKKFIAKNIKHATINPLVPKYTHEEFWKNCGDGYISSAESGARVVGVLECVATDVHKLSTIKTIMNSKVGIFGVDGSMKFTEVIDTVNDQNLGKCKILIEKEGGTGNIALDKDKFASSLTQYVENATLETARPIAVGISTYNTVMDETFLQYWRDFEAHTRQQNSLLNSRFNNVQILMGRWQDIENLFIQNTGREWPKRKEFEQRQAKITKDIVKTSESFIKCAKRPYYSPACSPDELNPNDWPDTPLE